MTRVSVVKYLNTAPLVWGMLHGEERGKYHLELATPARCADAVAAGAADVGIIPSIEYQRLERGRIIPGVSIASKGIVKSILLLSRAPIDKIRTVAMDNSSRTSVALVTILLRKFYGQRFEPLAVDPNPDEMLSRADAALLIGDPALTLKRRDVDVYDLAAEWKKFTGLPFVCALWVGREEADVARFAADFAHSRDEGLRHVDDIAAEWAPKLRLPEEAVKLYLTQNIQYGLEEDDLQGLRLFYRLAHEIGLIPSVKELRFAAGVTQPATSGSRQ